MIARVSSQGRIRRLQRFRPRSRPILAAKQQDAGRRELDVQIRRLDDGTVEYSFEVPGEVDHVGSLSTDEQLDTEDSRAESGEPVNGCAPDYNYNSGNEDVEGEEPTAASDLAKYTVKQLHQICRETGVTGYSKLRKQELIELLTR
jgi:hypothetical protein